MTASSDPINVAPAVFVTEKEVETETTDGYTNVLDGATPENDSTPAVELTSSTGIDADSPPDNGDEDEDEGKDAEEDGAALNATSGNESSSKSTPIFANPLARFKNIRISKPKLNFVVVPPVPPLAQVVVKVALTTVVALYVLNQKHMLPKGLSSIVSKTLFYPTLPITMSRRVGKWTTVVDDQVVLGGAPFGWLKKPEKLNKDYGVTGVINLCEEYKGPCKQYEKLGMEELHLPTTDHFEPSFEDMQTAVKFIKKYEEEDLGKVYVHCRAGHGRSAAIVYAYLMSKEAENTDVDDIDMEKLNKELCAKRNVRKTLYKQPNVNQFRDWLRVIGREKKDE